MQTDPEMDTKIPQHIGYIIDGNRRWAKQHGIPSYEGHLAGYNAIQEVARASFDAGVEYVSAYIFSTENWSRSQDEVSKLMGLVLRLLSSDLHIFTENNIRLKVLGTRQKVDPKILKEIEKAERATEHNTGGTLALCFNYGGQLEIIEACKKAVSEGQDMDDLTVENFSQYLYEPDIPPVDIIVRTSGEQRLSNFMLWRAAYSEFLFLEKTWPDMTKEDVSGIIEEYTNRSRRFGK